MIDPQPGKPRTIIVTGASSGIGAYCARALKRDGWTVFATARKPEDLAALEADGIEAFYLDYREPESIAALVESVLARTGGRLDALFNNGAHAQPGAVEDLPVEALRQQFEANFFGWHDLTRRVIPAMRRQRSGRIVMCSSVLGIVSMGFRGCYVAAKFALEGYSDALRIELANANIHVSVIEPGPIRTPFTKNAIAYARKNLDLENSVHAAFYKRRLRSMEKGGNTFGELEPDAVLEALIKACESNNPRPQYFVTLPTYGMSLLRRLASKRQLHAFLQWATDKGRRHA
jgi:NAD(P)-dependent dehydrogenase (short-subunit alcohol dehydrogenase family)